jgi:hypothetical protein
MFINLSMMRNSVSYLTEDFRGGEHVMSLEVMLYGGFRLVLEIYHNRVFIKTCK